MVREEIPVLLEIDKNVVEGNTCWDTEMTDCRENQRKDEQESLTQEIQVQSKSRESSPKRGDFNKRRDAQPGSKSRCDDHGKNFKTVDFQEVTRPESRSRSTFVKLWAPKETNEGSPKRIKVQLGSLSFKDTVNFLEAEKAGVIEEIREEHEKKLGSERGAVVPKVTSNKLDKKDVHASSFVIDKACCNDHQNSEATPERGESMEKRGRGPNEDEETIEEDKEAEQFRDQNPEENEGFSEMVCQQANINQNAEARKSQADARAKLRAEREARIAETLRSRSLAVKERRARARAEAEARAELKSNDLQARFEKVGKKEREKDREEKEYENYKSFRLDKWAGAAQQHLMRSPAEARMAREEEEDGMGKKLQNRARYHFEALKRIEESYIQRRNIYRENAERSRTGYPREIPSNVPRYWDNDRLYSNLHETRKTPLRKVAKKGKGGLNALLAPVFEEEDEFQQQFEDMGEGSLSESSDRDNNVKLFQRLKKAQLKAAEEQRAAAEAKAKQRKAQLKAAVERAKKARALSREVDRRVLEQKRGGECPKARNNNESVKERPAWLVPDTRPSNFQVNEPRVKRIKELNERARAEEERERERHRRVKEAEDRRARFRMRSTEANHRSESEDLYHRLKNPERKGEKPNPPAQDLNSRFKSLHTSPQPRNFSRFSSPPPNSQNGNNRRFRSPQSGPAKSQASEHIANWKKELETAQGSISRSMDRSKEKRVTIQDEPLPKFMNGENNNPRLKSGSTGEKVVRANDILCNEEYHKNKSPKRNHSPLSTGPTTQPKPDHYSSVEDDCPRDFRYRKENTREITKGRAPDEHEQKYRAKRAEKRENNQTEALNWLGKFYRSRCR